MSRKACDRIVSARLMYRNQGDGQALFLRKLAAEIMEQNSNQHGLTQKAAKEAAREQVGFNLAGYLDDFSKALSVSVDSSSERHATRDMSICALTGRAKCVCC